MWVCVWWLFVAAQCLVTGISTLYKAPFKRMIREGWEGSECRVLVSYLYCYQRANLETPACWRVPCLVLEEWLCHAHSLDKGFTSKQTTGTARLPGRRRFPAFVSFWLFSSYEKCWLGHSDNWSPVLMQTAGAAQASPAELYVSSGQIQSSLSDIAVETAQYGGFY